MSSEATPAGGIKSAVPVLIMAAVAAMLGFAGLIDGWKANRKPMPAATLASTVAPAPTDPTTASAVASAALPLTASTDADTARIEGIVKSYLLRNPEILAEVQQAFEAKMEAKRTAQMTEALASHSADLFKAASAPFAGNPDGDVTVVEFFDYNCGYCRRAIGDIAKVIDSDKNLQFVFKEFPIFGKDSEAAARIAIAAKSQGKYWELHQAMFASDGKLNEASTLAIAEKTGLDMTRLKVDMASAATEKEIADVRALAEKLGIQGTPHFFVGDKVIPGAPEDLYDQLTTNISDVRKNGCSVC